MFTRISISRSFTKSQWFSFSTGSTGHVGHQAGAQTGTRRRGHRTAVNVLWADSRDGTGKAQSQGGHRTEAAGSQEGRDTTSGPPMRCALLLHLPCTTPQGYCRARTSLFPTFTSSVLPTTAKGKCAWKGAQGRLSTELTD